MGGVSSWLGAARNPRASGLIIGMGASGQLPIMLELYEEARRRGVEVVAEPTKDACRRLRSVDPQEVSSILHVTCRQ